MSNDWKSIETAPKDGTAVDLFVMCGGNPLSAYSRRVVYCWFNPRKNIWEYDPEDKMNSWPVISGGNYEITHWMPIPEPPKK